MHIDIHAHFFNTRYLPIAGVARSRGVPRFLAGFIAWVIRGLTPDDDSLERDGSWFARDLVLSEFGGTRGVDPLPAELTPAQAIERFASTVPDEALDSEIFEDVMREAAQMPGSLAFAAPVAPATTDQRRDWLRGYLDQQHAPYALATTTATSDDAGEPGVGGILAFIYNLCCREKTLAQLHQHNSTGVGLFVHLMMDMQWPYRDKPNYEYPRQIRRIRQLCRQSEGKIVPFVAFDAYRPDSLELVEDALKTKSFVGVKFYAPSGYRPDDNTHAVRAPGVDVDPERLDRRCLRLIDLCHSLGAPIMAHCTPNGMEVDQDGHSGFNADPEYWRGQLARLPDLRLCFAHAGGRGHWFPENLPAQARPGHYPWAKGIVDLCTTYPNVYTDFSHLGEALDKDAADGFGTVLAKGINDSAGTPFPLGHKIMYGTDFPMPLPAGGWGKYYQTLLGCIRRNPTLAPLEDLFFRRNAIAYLSLRSFIDERGRDLTPDQVRVLTNYA